MKGFTQVELLVTALILLILAGMVYLIINPAEFTRKVHDETRVADLSAFQATLDQKLKQATESARVLCANGQAPCTTPSIPVPTDPLNKADYHYRYYSDGATYEIDAGLESQTYLPKMTGDSGNCDTRYEVGTNLSLLGC